MKFQVKGEHNTFRATITWEDGRLEGPEDLVAAVEREARRLDGKPIVARDADHQTFSTTDHLQNPHSARELIRSQLDPSSPFELEVLDGEFPPAPRYRTRLNESS
jgi:hypothetical protein